MESSNSKQSYSIDEVERLCNLLFFVASSTDVFKQEQAESDGISLN